MQAAAWSKLTISTHAPRTGSDTTALVSLLRRMSISTHAPRTGSDAKVAGDAIRAVTFQPTLPARGATISSRRGVKSQSHFNPRSPHGERRISAVTSSAISRFQPTLPARGATARQPGLRCRSQDFNPRSPHGERPYPIPGYMVLALFQPTLPARGATFSVPSFPNGQQISTHAPRTGSDNPLLPPMHLEIDFNPRSPHGERLIACY